MPDMFGTVQSSSIVDGTERIVFRIPAFSKRAAQLRARANARVKDLENASVDNIFDIGPGSIPGQTIYRVEVTAPR